MQKLKFYDSSRRYPDDCERICKVVLSHGCLISPREAESLWEDFSESMAAGWMGLSVNDEDIWQDIAPNIPIEYHD